MTLFPAILFLLPVLNPRTPVPHIGPSIHTPIVQLHLHWDKIFKEWLGTKSATSLIAEYTWLLLVAELDPG